MIATIATIAAFLINKRQRRQRDRRRGEQLVPAQLENSIATWAWAEQNFPEFVAMTQQQPNRSLSRSRLLFLEDPVQTDFPEFVAKTPSRSLHALALSPPRTRLTFERSEFSPRRLAP
jgi:hypothetical protein